MFSNRRGGGIVIDGTCFENNKVNSVGPIVTRRLDTQVAPQVTNTFADTATADGTCGVLSDIIVADLNTLEPVVSTTCLGPTTNVCALTGTELTIDTPAPTPAPTPQQTVMSEAQDGDTSTAATAKTTAKGLVTTVVLWSMLV